MEGMEARQQLGGIWAQVREDFPNLVGVDDATISSGKMRT